MWQENLVPWWTSQHSIIQSVTFQGDCTDVNCSVMSDFQIQLPLFSEEGARISSPGFTCTYCGTCFRTGENLREHALAAHGDKNYMPFVCMWRGCNRRFGWKGNFQRHFRVHTNSKPLKCRICEYRCRNHSSLQWHVRRHHIETFHPDEAADDGGKCCFTYSVCLNFNLAGNMWLRKCRNKHQLLPYFGLYKGNNQYSMKICALSVGHMLWLTVE